MNTEQQKAIDWWNNDAKLKFHLMKQYYPYLKRLNELMPEEIIKIYNGEHPKPEQSKQPLYKVLNEKRIQNEFFASISGIGIYDAKKVGTFAFLDLNKKGVYFADIPYDDEKLGATFDYASLAVNNLHILAEALEPFIKLADAVLKDTLKTPDSPLYGYNDAVFYVRDLIAAKQALINIS